MPYVRVGQQAFLVRLGAPNHLARPVVPNQPIHPRFPMYHQLPRPSPPNVVRNQVPRQLPVLHAPFFPKENGYYEEEEEEQQQQLEYEEAYAYPTMFIPDQHGTFIQQYSNYPFFRPHPQQQLIHPIQPKPPSYVYYRR
jgi:hypothetical protein